MKIYYISPSTIPSRLANSIHVVNMCEALNQLNHDVTLFVRSETLDSGGCKATIKNFYGIDSERLEVVVIRNRMARGVELVIALRALLCFVIDVFSGDAPDFIISRNLYGAVLLGLLFRRKVVYETHAPEKGLRQMLQGWLVRSTSIPCIVISGALRKLVASLHGVSGDLLHVMHDAARAGQGSMNERERHSQRQILIGADVDLVAYDRVAGYFGHLYPGRGIQVIQGVASANSNFAFIVYGGNEKEINSFRNNNTIENLYFMGHLQPRDVREAMAMMDVLLMPYQKSVSVGMDGVDTSQWMSPMKMFEYMAVGVPIIASRLPVLEEVLKDESNCLLATPHDADDWSLCLNRLQNDLVLAERIAANAHAEYVREYNWTDRARFMLSL